MASPAQIAANRRNSLLSTGPTSAAGKAVCRFNALKSGIYAESLAIPGENSAELAALADSYHQRLQPADPIECFLVDALIDSDWKLRRYRKVETNIWRRESDAETGFPAHPILRHVHRRMDAAERSYHRCLRELKTRQATAQPVETAVSQPEIGSVPSQPQTTAPAQPAPPQTPAPTAATPPEYVPIPRDPPDFRIFHPITPADLILFDHNPKLAAKLHKPWNPTSRSGS
ncbi:MAG TPA: hypothetical protein VH640_19665 [Bryobacteraceae bacterium]|jgi:hypothetical protein